MEKPPDIPKTDPTLDAARSKAEQDNIAALQEQARGDTASLMARYGTRLALAGVAGGSPLTMSAVAGGMGKAA